MTGISNDTKTQEKGNHDATMPRRSFVLTSLLAFYGFLSNCGFGSKLKEQNTSTEAKERDLNIFHFGKIICKVSNEFKNSDGNKAQIADRIREIAFQSVSRCFEVAREKGLIMPDNVGMLLNEYRETDLDYQQRLDKFTEVERKLFKEQRQLLTHIAAIKLYTSNFGFEINNRILKESQEGKGIFYEFKNLFKESIDRLGIRHTGVCYRGAEEIDPDLSQLSVGQVIKIGGDTYSDSRANFVFPYIVSATTDIQTAKSFAGLSDKNQQTSFGSSFNNTKGKGYLFDLSGVAGKAIPRDTAFSFVTGESEIIIPDGFYKIAKISAYKEEDGVSGYSLVKLIKIN